ncbi:MAG TPA: DUF456 domain-containing protein [Pirellulales bacterium]|jgi:uncharacterized protein YqgC (DUF456 family)|nr:DUF456 domain-containing protein [Pirellulales bacterium]
MTITLEVAVYLTVLLGGFVLTIFSLPGNWIIVGASMIYAWMMPDDRRWDLSLPLIVGLTVLAIAGEIVETFAAARSAQKLGASRRAALLALVGSIVGAVFGTVVIPIPLVGTVLGACAGAAFGAVCGEVSKRRPLGHSFRVGAAAFQGQFVGWTAKAFISALMVIVAIAGVVLD